MEVFRQGITMKEVKMKKRSFDFMRKMLLFMLALMACTGTASTGPEGEDYCGIILWPYMKERNVSGFSLNLFSGSYARFSGLGIGGLFQEAESFHGVGIGLVSCNARDTMRGVSLGGLAGGCGNLDGLGLGGLAFVADSQSGWSWGALFSDVDTVNGWHDSVLYSRANVVNGCQTSCLLSQCDSCLRGAQFALFTYAADRLEGCQIGLVNITSGRVSGIQLGLINVAPGTWNFPLVNLGQ